MNGNEIEFGLYERWNLATTLIQLKIDGQRAQTKKKNIFVYEI